MKNRRNSSGVFEDVWMNTQVGVDDLDRRKPANSDDADSPEDWEQIEEANIILNPDVDSMDWRG